ncbi:hypothetical protein JCM19297_2765 [Nonlabens ulvanivorans]|nr:hypothetical protein [Nonlabens ulvanivorans]GAK88252.1 hypothetical protein JCM19297_2765 [Nonlabens ulvanivorans]
MAIALMAMFSITSCEKDDTPLETTQEQPQFEIEKLTGSQLSNNRSLNKALSSAKESMSINTFQKSVYDSINGFWIDDSQVNHVSSGDYESYTFGVHNPMDSVNVKNLVFHKLKDSTYVPILITFNVDSLNNSTTHIEYKKLSSGIATSFYKSNNQDLLRPCEWNPTDCECFRITGGIITIETSDDPDCLTEEETDESISTGNDSNGGGANSDDDQDDDDNGGITNGPDTAGGWSSGGQSGGLPSDNNTNEPDDPCNDQLTLSNGDCAGVITSPVIDIKPAPAPVDDDTQAFFDSLEQTDEELWRFINDSDQDDLRQQLQNFLGDENHSDEAKDFAEEAIKAKQENENVKIDYDEKIINNLSQNRSEHSKIIENIKNQTGPITQIINTIFNANHNPNNLIFSEVPSGGNNATDIAWSNDNGAGTFEILITSNFLDNATDLAFVITIMHEMMHTNLSYLNQKDELPYQNIQPNLEHHEYPILIQEFLTYTADNNQGNDTDHEFMAENYLDLLSDAVYNWAITPIADGGGGYDVNDQTLRPHLDRLAWAGLSQSNFFNYPGAPPFGGGNPFLTPAWQDLVNSDPTLAQLILDTLAAEIHPNDIRVNQQLVLGNNF